MSTMISYPFELRRGGPLARLVLPSDLTRAEVTRLTAFLETLVTTGDPVQRVADILEQHLDTFTDQEQARLRNVASKFVESRKAPPMIAPRSRP